MHHRQILERVIAHALADALGEPLLLGELVPGRVPLVQRRGAVGLGQPVEMGELEARLVHLGEHGGGRRRRGMVEGDAMAERAPLLLGRVEQGRHDEGRAREMRHPMLGDRLVHLLGADGAEADMGAGDEEIDQGKHQPLQWNIGSVQR